MNGRNSSHASGQSCGDELLFSFLQMVSALCMSMYVSAIVWESESLPVVLMEVITQKCLCCFSPLSSSAAISQE